MEALSPASPSCTTRSVPGALSSPDLQSGYWALVRTGISLSLVESKTLLVFKAIFILKLALKKKPDRIYSSQSRLLFLSSHAKWFVRRHISSDRKRRPLYRLLLHLRPVMGVGSKTLVPSFPRSQSSLGQGSSCLSVPTPHPSSCQCSVKAVYTLDKHRNICSFLSPSSESYSSFEAQ